ncbi:MAG: VWA domain-containing protein, partial [Pedosphaera parvula]|nr:VWA domain-containing protein [Pedosphaera parvula]
YMRRIVVFSDGNETLGNALDDVKSARAEGIEVDVVPLQTGGRQEVRIREVSAPSQTSTEEPFQLRIVVQAEQECAGTLQVYQRAGTERRMVRPQVVQLQKGDNVFLLTQELPRAGFYEYEVAIASEADTFSQNNQGRAFTMVEGEPVVLCVAGSPENGERLEQALTAEGLQIEHADPFGMPNSLAQLQNYDAVVLSDVSSTQLSPDQLSILEAMVRDLGIGLVMIGGPNSFGAGGYLDTPVERALPVDMDIKQRKVLPRGALVVVMHTCEIPSGNVWARDIALAALNVLASQDLMGALGYMYDTSDSWIFQLQPVGDKSKARQAIVRGSTTIGDMPATGPTLNMAYKALSGADAAVKRVVLISDGDPGAPPSSLISAYASAKIAISTVCIAPHSASDQGMLRTVAEATGGNYYFVTDPQRLPQIFTKEASVVKKGMLVEEEFVPKPLHDSELLSGLGETTLPALLGYVVTSPKENATIPLISHEGDPVLAH